MATYAEAVQSLNPSGMSWADRAIAESQGYKEKQEAEKKEAERLADLQRQKDLMDQATAARDADLAKGKTRGLELFGNESLGRLNLTDRTAQAKGLSDEEMNAFRTKTLTNSNQQLSGNLRALQAAQALAGVRGGLASAQKAKILSDSQKANVGAENDLFIKNIDYKRSGLSALEDAQKYNIGQANKEKFGQLGTELGYGSLGAGDRSAIAQQIVGEQQARATAEAAKDDGGGCCFIFLEGRYGNGKMDAVVRRYRDEYMTLRNQRGYYKLAEVLVPLMRKSRVMKFLVQKTMCDPMVAYGKFHYQVGSKSDRLLGRLFTPLVRGWLGLFDYLGNDHAFIRENGEVI